VLQSITDRILVVGGGPLLPVDRDHRVHRPVVDPLEPERDGGRWFQPLEGQGPVLGPLAERCLGLAADWDQVMGLKRAPQRRELNDIDFIAILNAHYHLATGTCAV
jgi:hypothetical protein